MIKKASWNIMMQRAMGLVLSLTMILDSAWGTPLVRDSHFGRVALAPVSVFKLGSLDQEASKELCELGFLLYEHRDSSNENLLELAEKQRPDWYRNTAKAVWIYFDYIQRVSPDRLIIPFSTGGKRFTASFAPPHAGISGQQVYRNIAIDIEESPEVSMVSPQELEPSSGNVVVRFLRYVRTMFTFRPPPPLQHRPCRGLFSLRGQASRRFLFPNTARQHRILGLLVKMGDEQALEDQRRIPGWNQTMARLEVTALAL